MVMRGLMDGTSKVIVDEARTSFVRARRRTSSYDTTTESESISDGQGMSDSETSVEDNNDHIIYRSPFAELQLTSTPSIWEAVCEPPADLQRLTLDCIQERASKPALTDGITGLTYTYGDIQRVTKQISAVLLADYQIRPANRVLLFVLSTTDGMLLYLSLIRTGAVVVLGNPAYTEPELRHCYSLTKPSHVIAPQDVCHTIQRIARDVTTSSTITTLGTERDDTPSCIWKRAEKYSAARTDEVLKSQGAPCPIPDWMSTSTMAFSSGTSGLPKAVELSHKALVSLFLTIRPTGSQNMSKMERVLVLPPLFHVAGLGICLMSLIKGDQSIFCCTKPFSLERLTQVCIDWRCERVTLVPTLVQSMVKQGFAHKIGDAGHMTQAVVGAAPLREWLQNEAIKAFKASVVQGYGMTETAGGIIRAIPGRQSAIGSIGTLGGGIHARLVNSDGVDVKKGEAGELILKAATLMTGYYNNEKATKETIDTEGWLHTGDLAMIDSTTGDVFIIDRIKELIKYKGYQVAPAELESILLSHDDVLEVGVVGILEPGQVEELPRAYVVRKGGKDAEELVRSRLQLYVNSQVSSYKRLRGGIVFVDSLPMTGSKKLQRTELHKWARHSSKDIL